MYKEREIRRKYELCGKHGACVYRTVLHLGREAARRQAIVASPVRKALQGVAQTRSGAGLLGAATAHSLPFRSHVGAGTRAPAHPEV